MENSEENVYNISTFQSFQRFNNEWTLFLLIKTTKLVPDRIKCGDCHVKGMTKQDEESWVWLP